MPKSANNDRKTYIADDTYPRTTVSALPFPRLTPLQSCFRNRYNPRRNTVVEAGVGGGQTAFACIATSKVLAQGKRVIVLTPTEAIATELAEVYMRVYGKKLVGVHTSNRPPITSKYVVITTPEVFIPAGFLRGEGWTKADLLIGYDVSQIIDESEWAGAMDSLPIAFEEHGGTLLYLGDSLPDKRFWAEILLDADLFMSKPGTATKRDKDLSPDSVEFQGFAMPC